MIRQDFLSTAAIPLLSRILESIGAFLLIDIPLLSAIFESLLVSFIALITVTVALSILVVTETF